MLAIESHPFASAAGTRSLAIFVLSLASALAGCSSPDRGSQAASNSAAGGQAENNGGRSESSSGSGTAGTHGTAAVGGGSAGTGIRLAGAAGSAGSWAGTAAGTGAAGAEAGTGGGVGGRAGVAGSAGAATGAGDPATGVADQTGSAGTVAAGHAGGVGTAGVGGSGGSTEAGVSGSIAPIACTGTWHDPGELGSVPQSMRTDVTVSRLFAIPGDSVRIARDPVSHKLYLLTQAGEVHEVDLVSASTRLVWAAADMKIPSGNEALGMAFTPDGTLYVVAHVTSDVSPDLSRATIVRSSGGAGKNRAWSVFAASDAYPRSNTFFDHEWSGIASSADGKFVYVNCGSRTDHGEIETNGNAELNDLREAALTARILRLPTDAATPLTIPDDEQQLTQQNWVYARGTRNAFDLEFAPNGDLMAGDNGPDGDYHEELNWLREGHHYGFPWRLGNEDNLMAASSYDPKHDVRLQPEYTATRNNFWYNDPDYPARPSGVRFDDPILNSGPDADQYRDPSGSVLKASDTGAPFGTFSDHGSPLGLTFDPGAGALCGEFSGKAFILRFGVGTEMNDFEPGRDLLFLDLTKTAASYALSAHQLVRGLSAPIDALIDGDSMYIVDRSTGEGSGALYTVKLPNGR